MEKSLFIKYIKNQCTPEELTQVIKWLENEASSVDGRAFLKNLWNEMDGQSEEAMIIDYERLLDKVHHNLNISESQKDKRLKNQNISGKSNKNIILNIFSKVAAVLFIPLLSLSIYTYINNSFPGSGTTKSNPVFTEVTAPYGSIISVDLPDGSKAWLNNGSHLKFPQKFKGRMRKVELSGEAYFKVAHNTKKPFLVTGNEIQVLAVGTEFNMMAYPDENTIETTLKSGKVIIQKLSSNGKMNNIFVMKPNQHTIYSRKEKKISYKDDDPDKYISWMKGKLIFKDDPLDVVIKRLGRWYNVDIQVTDTELSQFTYTATFVDETLTQVLDLLVIATPVKYKMSTRTKQEDGTFSKRKVVISYAKKNN
jgi:hypothetical protein